MIEYVTLDASFIVEARHKMQVRPISNGANQIGKSSDIKIKKKEKSELKSCEIEDRSNTSISSTYKLNGNGMPLSMHSMLLINAAAKTITGLSLTRTIIDGLVAKIVALLPNLETLTFLNCSLAADSVEAFGAAIEKNMKLDILKLRQCNVTDGMLRALWRNQAVKQIEIRGASVESETLAALQKRSSIASLTLLDNGIPIYGSGALALVSLGIPSLIFNICPPHNSDEPVKNEVMHLATNRAELMAMAKALDFSEITQLTLKGDTFNDQDMYLLPRSLKGLFLMDFLLSRSGVNYVRNLAIPMCGVTDENQKMTYIRPTTRTRLIAWFHNKLGGVM